MSRQKPARTVEIFYSYAPADIRWRDELEKHLSVFKHQGLISSWHDRLIEPGTNWENEIDSHLTTAHIILLLISANFLASDYCYGIELNRAMERHNKGEARVVPIILRPVIWRGALFGHLQALPQDGKPVTQWSDPDLAFVDIVHHLHKIINDAQTLPSGPPSQALHTTSAIGNVADPPSQDRWERAGTLGDLIRSFVSSKEWGRAESTARMIAERSIRSEILCNLAFELAENQQWQRAEAIAYTIEVAQIKEDTLAKIVDYLISAQQWGRAESIVRSIENEATRYKVLQKLSRASLSAGEYERAFAVAYTPLPSFQRVNPSVVGPQLPASAPLQRRSALPSLLVAGLILGLIVILALVFFLLLR